MLEHYSCTYVAMVKFLPVNRIFNTLRCFGILEGTMQNKVGRLWVFVLGYASDEWSTKDN